MRRITLLALLFATACRPNQDVCKKLLTNLGKQVTEASLKACADHVSELQRVPQMKCALAAANRSEADKCFAADLKELQETSKKVEALTAKVEAESARVSAVERAVAPFRAELVELNKQFDVASDAAVKAATPEVRAPLRESMRTLSARMKEIHAKIDSTTKDTLKP